MVENAISGPTTGSPALALGGSLSRDEPCFFFGNESRTVLGHVLMMMMMQNREGGHTWALVRLSISRKTRRQAATAPATSIVRPIRQVGWKEAVLVASSCEERVNAPPALGSLSFVLGGLSAELPIGCRPCCSDLNAKEEAK